MTHIHSILSLLFHHIVTMIFAWNISHRRHPVDRMDYTNQEWCGRIQYKWYMLCDQLLCILVSVRLWIVISKWGLHGDLCNDLQVSGRPKNERKRTEQEMRKEEGERSKPSQPEKTPRQRAQPSLRQRANGEERKKHKKRKKKEICKTTMINARMESIFFFTWTRMFWKAGVDAMVWLWAPSHYMWERRKLAIILVSIAQRDNMLRLRAHQHGIYETGDGLCISLWARDWIGFCLSIRNHFFIFHFFRLFLLLL